MKTLLALVLASSVAFAQAPVVVPAPKVAEKAPVVKVEKKKAKKKVVKPVVAPAPVVAAAKPVEVKK